MSIVTERMFLINDCNKIFANIVNISFGFVWISITCQNTYVFIQKMKTSVGICPVYDTVTDLALWTNHKGDLY